MKQLTFASATFSAKKKTTKCERFLADMDAVVPWAKMQALIEPPYSKTGPKGGRPPTDLPKMPHVWCLQQWLALSEPGMEEALCNIESMRRFAGFELGEDAIPDETTIFNLRPLLEKYKLYQADVCTGARPARSEWAAAQVGRAGRPLIAAPPSTKNAKGKRDPEMTQTKKGSTWHFGMKVQVGADSKSGLIHSVRTTTTKIADCAEAEHLLHGEEDRVFGDRGYDYPRVHQIIERIGALDGVANRRTAGIPKTKTAALFNRVVAKIRSRVRPPALARKSQFGYTKVRYRSQTKNISQIVGLFAFFNLYFARRQLMPQGA